MRLKPNHFIKVLLLAFIALTVMAGCKKGIPLVSDVAKTDVYTLPQSMIIVATERNRYQDVYTSQIWSEELPDGRTFQSYLLEQIQIFLQDVKLMNLMAEEKGVTITGSEKETLRELSREYYESLTEDDLAYTGATEEDVRIIYEAYYMAQKAVTELTADMNLEISDSEAKVISVEEIVLSDEDTAADVLTQVQAEGADFSAIAKQYTEGTETVVSMGRGDNPGTVEDSAFALSTGEISSVVSQDGSFYILKCISDYDADATQARKEGLYQKRKKEAFSQVYNEFKMENPITFDNSIWENISFSKDDKTTTSNFFELYKQVFPSLK